MAEGGFLLLEGVDGFFDASVQGVDLRRVGGVAGFCEGLEAKMGWRERI